MIDNTKEYILCAAIHILDGNVYEHQPKGINSGIVYLGRRHHNCFRSARIEKYFPRPPILQGFITSKDRFVDRKEAMIIACEAGQVIEIKESRKGILVSEDLY